MLSQSQIKLISSLRYKKYRDLHNLFIAEGEKLVYDLSRKFKCKYLITTSESNLNISSDEYIMVKYNELKKISSLSSPNNTLGIFQKPINIGIENIDFSKIVIVLDSIQDPGNLGTIVRIADWYNIDYIICSPTTTDIFNPKTIQATMGAITNVKVIYTKLTDFLSSVQLQNIPIYGTFLKGNNIYKQNLTANGIILLGNEGRGISEDTARYVSHCITIPNFSDKPYKSESLNVAISAAIICSEFHRFIYKK